MQGYTVMEDEHGIILWRTNNIAIRAINGRAYDIFAACVGQGKMRAQKMSGFSAHGGRNARKW